MEIKKPILLFFCLHVIINNAHNTDKIVQNMSLDEKLGQLFIDEVSNKDTDIKQLDEIQNQIINTGQIKTGPIELIKKYKIGGIHFTGYGTLKNCFNAINKLQKISNIPLFISQDFEWGLGMRLQDAISFPKNMTLGAIQNDNLIYELGREIGRQCRILGVNINFAPVADINNNPANQVIGHRSFGDDKYNVARKSIHFMRGLQSAGVIACAKHFCGHGDTQTDSHHDLPVIYHDINRLEQIELYPFKQLIDAGVKSIMSAHIHVPDIDSTPNTSITLSYNALTELLQKILGFKGLIITDALNMKAISKYFPAGQAEVKAFLAGNDILLMSTDIPQAINSLKDALVSRLISIEELDRRVLKILKSKSELKPGSKYSYSNFHTPHAKELKRKLFEEAVTLVRDELNLIPSNLNNLPVLRIRVSDNKLPEQPKKDKPVIIELHDLTKSPKTNYGITPECLNFLNECNSGNGKIILVIFGNPYALKLFTNFKTILMGYESDPEAQKAAYKIISGKLKPKGKLPISA